MNKRTMALAGLGIFVVGLLTGSLAAGAFIKYRFSPYRMDKVGPAGFFLERMDHAVGLSDAQAAAVRPIVEEVLAQVRQARQPCLEAEDDLMRQGAQRIRALLDEDQRERFDRFLERGRKFRGRVFGPPPPPPSGSGPDGPPPPGGPHPPGGPTS